MPDPQTSNLQLFIPLNGADIGTWDVPMNANWTQLDNCFGANANVALSNVPVTLSAPQYNTRLITFTGALTGNVEVTFPAYGRTWIVQNNCAANTSFRVTCRSSTGTNFVALPPNEPIMILSDGSGTTVKFMGLGRVGTYWDFAGSAVPIWVTGSSPQPYLNCDGTAFSSATYPALRDYLGGTTLPDSRGRFRAALGQGTGRLTGTLDGNTLLSSGGSQSITQANLPNYNLTVTDPGHAHVYTIAYNDGTQFQSVGGPTALNQTTTTSDTPSVTGITVGSGGSGTGYAPPGYVGGLTL